jgi:hypothetical protein
VNAAFDDCGRLGRLFSVLASMVAAWPVRRSGSKCESTMSRPPFGPPLGKAVRFAVTWFVPPYVVSRYQTSMPGALYLIFSTFQAPSREYVVS